MGPPSYMRSVVDRNVVIRRIPVYVFRMDLRTNGDFCSIQLMGYFAKDMGCSLCGTDWTSCEQVRIYLSIWMTSQLWFVWMTLLRGLRCRSAAALLLGLRVRIPPRAWLSVSFELCVSSGRGLCDEPIPLPEESYRMCVSLNVTKCKNNTQHLQRVGRKKSDWEVEKGDEVGTVSGADLVQQKSPPRNSNQGVWT
jgi:hypothetical protein